MSVLHSPHTTSCCAAYACCSLGFQWLDKALPSGLLLEADGGAVLHRAPSAMRAQTTQRMEGSWDGTRTWDVKLISGVYVCVF